MSRAIHEERPGRRRFLGLLASAVLLLLIVGMPIWLALSSGPPTLHIDVGRLWQAMEHRRPGDVRQVAEWLGRVAVLLAWFAWAWLTLCVVLEVAAWRSGRSTVHLPASRSVQYAAALLVGTAFAVGSLGRLPVHGSGEPVSVPIVVWSSPAGPPGGDEAAPSDPADARSVATGGPTEWSPHRLPGGGGADGRRSDPDGWPVDGARASGAVTTTGPVHTVAPRESLWSIAELRLGAARRWRDIAELNYGRPQVGGGALEGDHWLRPGWELVLPSGAAPSMPAQLHPGPEPSREAPETALGTDPPSTSTPVRAPGAPGGTPAVPVGAGIVGVGMADLIDRLRRVQQRHRVRGGQIRLPEQLLRPLEQRLRLDGGRADLEAIEAAVMTLADTPGGWPEGCRLTGATVGADQVRLVFDVATPPEVPTPFATSDDGLSLTVDRTALGSSPLLRRGDRHRFAAPTLVTVGRADGVLVMVDLEGLGAIAVAGDPVAAEGLGRAMALELAGSRWSSAFDLVLVGFGAALAKGDRVTVVADAGPVIADVAWRRLMMSVRVDDSPESSVDAARRNDPMGDWRPVVVVCAPEVPPADVTAILELATDGRLGICAVAMAGADAPPTAAGHVLRAGPTLEVLGAVVGSQGIDAVELDQATQLVETASDCDAAPGAVDSDGRVGDDMVTDDTVSDDTVSDDTMSDGTHDDVSDDDAVPATGAKDLSRVAPYGRPPSATSTRVDPRVDPLVAVPGDSRVLTVERPGHGPATARIDRPDIEVEVGVLGTVQVHGAARKFTRAWALELVVYLAMHPGGVTNEAWATALWPDRLMAPSSLHSTVSVARRALGSARDGSDHLPRSHGRLSLAPTVGTDWARFQALAASEDPDRWEAALTVVRGRPFEGIRATDWSLLDGTAPSIESAVVDLSGRLAGARLRAGDPYGAEWAARKGLLVSPYDERLYRMLLRTADAAGNPGGVETVMAELVRVVADEVEPVESVHPSTLALYRSLSRRSRSVVDGPPRR